MEVKLFNLLRKEAECSFCIHPFNKPKTLPCLHSFCLDCLNKYATTRRQQGHTTFDCPECVTTFPLPDNDTFDAYQTAFHQNRLLDILALEKSGTDQQKSCDNCDENAAASSYCFQCQTFLCSVCLDKHNGLRVARGHHMVSLQNLQTTDVEALIQRPLLCEKPYHEREALEYYCEDCRVCICHKCALVGHNKHSMLDIPAVAEQHKRQITKDVEEMKSKVSEWKQKIEKSKMNFEAIEQQVVEARHKTQATVEVLIRDLKQHETNIMRELDEIHHTQQDAHSTQLENFELSLAQLNSAIEYAETILKRSIGPEILQTQEAITQRYDELLTCQNITPQKPVHVSFVTSRELCKTVPQSALGRVVVSLTDPSRSVAEGEGLQEAKCGERAEFTVITKDAEGQQCYDKTDQVTVHIQTAAQEELEMEVEDKQDGTYHVTYGPQRHRQCLMVSVNGQPLTGSPWKVHVLPHKYQAISSFGSKGTEQGQFNLPSGLSVSRTGNIAVCEFENKRVQVFTSEGEFRREFGQGRLNGPISLAYTSIDHFIVLDLANGVVQALMFNESGTFLRQFSPAHLKCPSGVSVANDGRVIVCDLHGRLVKLLSPDGEELIQSFSTPFWNTVRKYTVHHNEKFFVPHYENICIRVFDVAGNYLHDIGCKGTGDGQLQGPCGIAIDKFGHLLVVDQGNHRLQVFTTEGEFVSKTGGQGTELGQFNNPTDVAVSKDGHVYVTDFGNDRVQILI